MPLTLTKIHILKIGHTIDALSGSEVHISNVWHALRVDQDIINKTITNRSENGLNTRFIKSIKAAGALVSLKGLTGNSQWPYLVRKAILGTLLLLIHN